MVLLMFNVIIEQSLQKTGQLISKLKEISAAGYRYYYRLAGVIGPIVLLLTDNISVIFSPRYDPLKMSISELALGPMGWLLRTGFVIFSFLLVMEFVGLSHYIPNVRIMHIATFIVLAAAIGFVLMAIFTTDPSRVPHTIHGLIHISTTFAVAILFPVGVFMIGYQFKVIHEWRGLYVFTMVTFGIAIICGIIRIIMPVRWTFFGLCERIFLWNGLAWLEVVGIKLLAFTAQRHHEPEKNHEIDQTDDNS